jgi:transcriptional regulator with XRE-family HTH domain
MTDDIDVHVGRQLRRFRAERGMSQGELGRHVGLSHQQIQKYENGTNRIGAGRLYRFARVLDIQVADFFERVEETGPAEMERFDRRLATSRRTRRIALSLQQLPDPMRRQIYGLVEAASGVSLDDDPDEESRPKAQSLDDAA